MHSVTTSIRLPQKLREQLELACELLHRGKNGLKKVSQIMIDKVMSLPREKIHSKIGTLSIEQLSLIDNSLKLWLDLC